VGGLSWLSPLLILGWYLTHLSHLLVLQKNPMRKQTMTHGPHAQLLLDVQGVVMDLLVLNFGIPADPSTTLMILESFGKMVWNGSIGNYAWTWMTHPKLLRPSWAS
jgi:hypothetical protein